MWSRIQTTVQTLVPLFKELCLQQTCPWNKPRRLSYLLRLRPHPTVSPEALPSLLLQGDHPPQQTLGPSYKINSSPDTRCQLKKQVQLGVK